MSDKKNKLSIYCGWAVKRLALLLFDILVVNLSYYVALVIRFYVNREFRAIAIERYLPAFWQFAPYYTVLCVAVFLLFKLYNNRWKHAGLHDLNRIFAANAITAAIHIIGTLVFVCRMPITYYFIGAVLQFLLIAASRFTYRLFVLEGSRIRRMNSAKLNVMIVGVGETARILRSQIENDSTNVTRPVCIFSYHNEPAGKMINGLPVLTNISKLSEHFSKYQVKCVILADSIMPIEIRRQIREVCQKHNVEVQDFSGYLTSESHQVTLKRLMEYANGMVEIKLDGNVQSFQNGEQALMAYPGQYEVKQLYANADKLGVEIARKTVILNDTNQDWVRDTEDKSGEEISFF